MNRNAASIYNDDHDLNSVGTCSTRTMATNSHESEVDTTFDPSFDLVENGDSEDEGDSQKQNGYAMLSTDRYGFTGGAQYTEPGRSVII